MSTRGSNYQDDENMRDNHGKNFVIIVIYIFFSLYNFLLLKRKKGL